MRLGWQPKALSQTCFEMLFESSIDLHEEQIIGVLQTLRPSNEMSIECASLIRLLESDIQIYNTAGWNEKLVVLRKRASYQQLVTQLSPSQQQQQIIFLFSISYETF